MCESGPQRPLLLRQWLWGTTKHEALGTISSAVRLLGVSRRRLPLPANLEQLVEAAWSAGQAVGSLRCRLVDGDGGGLRRWVKLRAGAGEVDRQLEAGAIGGEDERPNARDARGGDDPDDARCVWEVVGGGESEGEFPGRCDDCRRRTCRRQVTRDCMLVGSCTLVSKPPEGQLVAIHCGK